MTQTPKTTPDDHIASNGNVGIRPTLPARRSQARILDTLLGIIAVLCLIGLIREASLWLQIKADNEQRAHLDQVAISDTTPPELLLAKADALEHSPQPEAARTVYDTLLHSAKSDIKAIAHYKLGTRYLAEAAPVWNAVGVLEYAKVNTLVALAKEHLRSALRLNPTLWEARYNLEYAERITPPPKEHDKAQWHGSKSSLFATLPSLPGGAP